MTQEYPFTPTSELMQQWLTKWKDKRSVVPYDEFFAAQAAQWGADQELEACCEWIDQNTGRWDLLAELRAVRRPKPPSLKAQALEALDQADKGLNESEWQQRSDTIRRALEQLDD